MTSATGGGERLFLIGTGLTMTDVVLAAAARADGSRFHALSRHACSARDKRRSGPMHSAATARR